MDSALWLLHWLRLRAWFRRMFRNAGTVRGALFMAAGFLFFAFVVGPNIVLRLVQVENSPAHATSLERARHGGPLLLFAYCALTVLFASAEQGISFTAAEVQFLFSGPFSRRQVLAYKIAGNALLCCLYALFLTAFFFSYTGQPLAAYPGLVLTLWFIQFFSLAVTLLLNTIGRGRSPGRGASWWSRAWPWPPGGWRASAATAFPRGPGKWSRDSNRMTWFSSCSHPCAGLSRHALPTRFGLTSRKVRVRCAGVDAALLVLVFLLDAQYQEAAAAASERAYARMQRVRSGGAVAALAASGRPRLRLPPLPNWGGVGTLAWRQLTTGVRSLRPVLIFLGVFAVLIGGAWLALGTAGEDGATMGLFIGATVLGMTVAMLTPLLTFDFRGDIDRMDVLKALPLPPWRVALGQLLAPTLILSVVQLVVIALVQLLWGGVEVMLAGVAVFALPFNFLSIGLENLLFLWFPTRLVPAAPGDFQMMGRQTLILLAKFTALLVVVLPAALAGAVVYGIVTFVSNANGFLPAVAAGWLVLTVLSSGVVPLVALAYARFDVSRDTPP